MTSLAERFWVKVQPAAADECWIWQAARTHGYGRFWDGSRLQPAHRIAFEMLRGDIPPGLVLDHLCRTPPCVNPYHLDVVTRGENVRRGEAGANMRAKTHCPSGHPYDETNTRLSPSGARYCRTCRRLRTEAATRERRRLAAK